MSMMNFSKFEGPVEKQLRETGEWVTNQTERGFRSNGNPFFFFRFSLWKWLWLRQKWKMKMTLMALQPNVVAGKQILKFVFLWILPIWAFSLLVAVGAIKLNIPILNDLIMWTLNFVFKCISLCRLVGAQLCKTNLVYNTQYTNEISNDTSRLSHNLTLCSWVKSRNV